MKQDVVVCGGGAAGFFAAINIGMKCQGARITILEKSPNLLSKVRISGGGRCNVTNGRTRPSDLVNFYPRGEKKLYSLLKEFGPADMMNWLNSFNVPLKTEEDLRVFPKSDNSQTIIDCFLDCCKKYNIIINTKEEVTSIRKTEEGWLISTPKQTYLSQYVVIATGASSKTWKMISSLPATITETAPSLFTFNVHDERITGLQGVAFRQSQVKIAGTKLAETGPLLITHWGLSGPAVLKLSAWGARILKAQDYQFEIIINFDSETTPEDFRSQLTRLKTTSARKQISNMAPANIPKRYWHNLLDHCQIPHQQVMADLSKKQINKLTEECCQARFSVSGKSTFKDEFVTCGGVSLAEVNLKDMQSKKHEGLYFTGEVLDIDGITGGFNFQACWATGWAVSETISKELSLIKN